jgi:hypothetical protein
VVFVAGRSGAVRIGGEPIAHPLAKLLSERRVDEELGFERAVPDFPRCQHTQHQVHTPLLGEPE